MSPPEIPDAAMDAAYRTAIETDRQVDTRTILNAAWPHLYAAALRHAADEVDDRADVPRTGGVGSLIREGRQIAANDLRRLADEATP